MAQQTMIRRERSTRRASSSISARREPRRGEHVVPATRRACAAKSSKPVGVLGDERRVQHRARRGRLGLEQQPVQRLEERQVAVDADLQELVGQLRAAADQRRAAAAGS